MPSPVLPFSCKRSQMAGNWRVWRCSAIPSRDFASAMRLVGHALSTSVTPSASVPMLVKPHFCSTRIEPRLWWTA